MSSDTAHGAAHCMNVSKSSAMYYARPFYTNDGLLPNHFSLYAPLRRNVFLVLLHCALGECY